MNSVKMKHAPYALIRERDDAGDSGSMLISINPETGEPIGENGELHLGCAIQCGSLYARSFSAQDWWLTTPITEFLEVNEDNSEVKFKTGNSVYIVKSI